MSKYQSYRYLISEREIENDYQYNGNLETIRRMGLMTKIWSKQFSPEQEQEAVKALFALLDEGDVTQKEMSLVEYLGFTYDTQGKYTQIIFIKENIELLKIPIEYFLGYLPDQEEDLAPELKTKAKENALDMIKEMFIRYTKL
ncbi:MAG: hypothetical protein RLZZ499_2114 [Cyanobacteriota bacterium]|jgi:hypothetical protein